MIVFYFLIFNVWVRVRESMFLNGDNIDVPFLCISKFIKLDLGFNVLVLKVLIMVRFLEDTNLRCLFLGFSAVA